MENSDAANLSGDDNHMPPSTFKPRRRKLKLFLLFLIILFVGAVFGASKLFSKTNQIFTNPGNIFARFGKLITGNDQQLLGEDAGKINVLLLGIGGPGHDGPLLTDTMIVAQIDSKNSEVALISIPRDFVVQIKDAGFKKINSAYAYAEAAKVNGGGPAAMDAAERVTGLKIPYFAVVDFKGFVKAVDHVGGLDITIDRTFTDSNYPNEKLGYLAPLTFTKGPEHMDGTRALQFSRSREGNNGEGSDFARSERQKKVITAFFEKVIKLNLTDLRTLNNLLTDFTQNFRTNLEPFELKRLADLAGKIDKNNVFSLSLEPQGNLICDGVVEDYTARAYVIQPCEGKTLADIHQFLKQALLTGKLRTENATVEIQNSTGEAAALNAVTSITGLGSNVKIVSFKSKTPYERTIIYDNSQNRRPKTLEFLKNNFHFTFADVPYTNSASDFVIILGKDAL